MMLHNTFSEKACQGQTRQLTGPFITYDENKVFVKMVTNI
jgi:hypothetical protein